MPLIVTVTDFLLLVGVTITALAMLADGLNKKKYSDCVFALVLLLLSLFSNSTKLAVWLMK